MIRLDLVVGPNGAGKSTFVALTLAPLLPESVFVNADEIAQRRWPDDPAARSYDAAQIAAQTRSTLIQQGRPFIAETVFSHPSKLDLIDAAHGAGYTVVLHVLLIPADLAVERVKHRVRAGGHDVPERKIRERHRRLWESRFDELDKVVEELKRKMQVQVEQAAFEPEAGAYGPHAHGHGSTHAIILGAAE